MCISLGGNVHRLGTSSVGYRRHLLPLEKALSKRFAMEIPVKYQLLFGYQATRKFLREAFPCEGRGTALAVDE